MKRTTSGLEGLFDTQIHEDLLNEPNESCSAEWLPTVGLAVGLIVAVIIMGGLAWQTIGAKQRDGSEHWVSGRQVGQLQPGAVVELAGVEIGRVQEIVDSSGVLSARLQLNREIAQELAADSQFTVRALNHDGYSNVGISVTAGQQSDSELPRQLQLTDSSGFAAEALQEFRDLITVGGANSEDQSPFGFGPMLATAVCIISVVVAKVAKALRPMLLLLMIAGVALVMVGLILVQQGVVSTHDLPAWAKSCLQTIPAESEQAAAD